MMKIRNDNLLNLAKGNSWPFFIIALPFIITAWAVFIAFCITCTIALLLGRRRAAKLLYWTKDVM